LQSFPQFMAFILQFTPLPLQGSITKGYFTFGLALLVFLVGSKGGRQEQTRRHYLFYKSEEIANYIINSNFVRERD